VSVLIPGRHRNTEIDGELLCPGVSTWNRRSRHWVEIEIYRLASGGYLIHRAGMSVVYHTADTRCVIKDGTQRGDAATVDDLPDEARPCPACLPPWPQDLGDKEPIRFEFPRHTFDKCWTAAQVIAKLTTIYKSDGSIEVREPAPVMELLDKAAEVDEAFAAEPLLTQKWA
jgi:hypothetical protein